MAYRLIRPRDLTQSQIRSGLSRTRREQGEHYKMKEFKEPSVHKEGLILQEEPEDLTVLSEAIIPAPKVIVKNIEQRINELAKEGYLQKNIVNQLQKEGMGHVSASYVSNELRKDPSYVSTKYRTPAFPLKH